MYPFKIKNQDDGSYKFELGNINMIIDGYLVEDGMHILTNPNKAIAYFNIESNIYGISNEPKNYYTVEAFYDAIYDQYLMFTTKGAKRSA